MLYLCSRARDHAAARRTQYSRRIEQPATVAWSRCRAPGYSCSLRRREYLRAVAAIDLGTGPWRSRLSSRWCSWAGWPLERELAHFGSRLSICPIVVSIGLASNTKHWFYLSRLFYIDRLSTRFLPGREWPLVRGNYAPPPIQHCLWLKEEKFMFYFIYISLFYDMIKVSIKEL